MLKILAADDEILFLKRICKTIDWEAIGFRIVGTANDGREALDKAIALKPDIALIDINMPYLNGLELVSVLAEKLPKLAVVIISGHNEFEYARQAMKLGVREYLLKPYNDEELIQIMLNIKAELHKTSVEEAMERRNQKSWIEIELSNQLVDSKTTSEDISKNLELLGLCTDSRYYGIISIEIDLGLMNQLENSEILLWKFIVLNVANDLIQLGDGKQYVLYGAADRVTIIAGFGHDRRDRELELLKQLEELRVLIARKFHFTVTIGVGNFHEDPKLLASSYKESLAAIRNNLILGKNRIIEFNSLETQTSTVGFYSSEVNDELQIYLRQFDTKRIVEKVEQIFHYIRERRFSIDNTYIICTGLVSICLSFIVQTGHKIEEVVGKDFSPLNKIKEMESLDLIEQWIIEVYRLTLEGCNQLKMTKSQILADEIKQFIENNYSDPELRVDKIARSLYVSENYLMSAFKKRFGITIVDQILATRMLKARELIRSGSIKLSAVSLLVGYNDPGYFSKSFKKYYGLSPSEYENETRNKQ